jgi:hypothetical protein
LAATEVPERSFRAFGLENKVTEVAAATVVLVALIAKVELVISTHLHHTEHLNLNFIKKCKWMRGFSDL